MSMSDKQVQKAGNNAQQMQAEIINITNVSGIDEKRAREIFNEMYAIARKDFTQDAYQCANERVAKFEEALIGSLKLVNKQISSGKLVELPSEISNEQRSILEQIYDLYDKNEEQKKMVTENFSLEWKKRETLSSLLKWWNDIPMAFDITTVGTVLAHANAQRCDSSIPPLE